MSRYINKDLLDNLVAAVSGIVVGLLLFFLLLASGVLPEPTEHLTATVIETSDEITLTLSDGRVMIYHVVDLDEKIHCHPPLMHNNHIDDERCEYSNKDVWEHNE